METCLKCEQLIKERDVLREQRELAEHLHDKLKAERDEYREALEKISDGVDESLLLDEQLSEDWDKLNNEVQAARKVLAKFPQSGAAKPNPKSE